MTEQTPQGEPQQRREPRDAAYWASYAETLKVTGVAEGATNINVEGRRAVGPLQGFGKLWQKTYRVGLENAGVTPAEVIKTCAWAMVTPSSSKELNVIQPEKGCPSGVMSEKDSSSA